MTDLAYPFDEIPEPAQAVEVADGVFWIRMPLPVSLDHINLWLLRDGNGWTIVDTGIKSAETRACWEKLFSGFMAGRPVKRLICTHLHPDHFGLAGWLCGRLDIMLWMARAEYLLGAALVGGSQKEPPPEIMRFYKSAGMDARALQKIHDAGYDNLEKIVSNPPAAYRRIRDGGTLTIDGRPWHLVAGRGHSPEHICLYSPDLGVMISGDQVLPTISSNVSVHATEPFSNPLDDWLASLQRFKELPENTLVLPAHGEPFYGLHTRLDSLIAGHQDRLDRMLDVCKSPMTAVEFIPLVFRRELKGFDYILGLGEVIAHLHYLVENDQLYVREDNDNIRRFSSS